MSGFVSHATSHGKPLKIKKNKASALIWQWLEAMTFNVEAY
ncbi:hypothetical protein [Comamonas sp. lk]|nr:hypothetical protein [Comamonas sp. lk]